MKSLTFLFVLFLSIQVFAQSTEADAEVQTGPTITFEEKSHNFGGINQGEKVQYDFVYKNTGSEPLIISNVRTSCGCTAPNWSKEPLPVGESATLKIVFNSTGKRGMQNKIITITSNATNNPERVKITGNVIYPPAASQ